MKCQLPGHGPLEFASYEEYDVHYRKIHVNRCSECNKNFPSEQILDLHLAEIHDPINEVRKARGEKIYACFAEGCDKMCSEPNKRRMHMVSKHHFPKDYDFAIIKDGIDGRNSMLRGSRNDNYVHKPRWTRTEKAKAKTDRTAAGKQDAAKKHIISDEDGKTPGDHPTEAEATEDVMDVVNPANEDSPAPGPSQDVDMKTDGNTPPASLSASKHAPDMPRLDFVKGAKKKGYQTKFQGEAKPNENSTGPVSAGEGGASSQPPEDPSDDPMEGLTASMSLLKFVPPSIRFGRGGGRGRGRGRGRGGFTRS
ncbi:Zinc finger C2H2-type protein [Macrophomina phaseolina MS6]|uniref:Zinc finger C2H2-type protein n=1 Tax=Macrophomina phaseolina (strain MS6) TaxID=1126212 RepID=K2RCX8_MACPH|nr:Zinc finger C2H2-type protein [Macrophomina phaseolina MS6]